VSDITASSAINGDADPAIIAPRAGAAARRAADAEPSLSEAQTSMARIKFSFEWDWPVAEAALNRAIELDSKNAEAHRMPGGAQLTHPPPPCGGG
jgi:hypothetical protein